MHSKIIFVDFIRIWCQLLSPVSFTQSVCSFFILRTYMLNVVSYHNKYKVCSTYRRSKLLRFVFIKWLCGMVEWRTCFFLPQMRAISAPTWYEMRCVSILSTNFPFVCCYCQSKSSDIATHLHKCEMF